MSCPNAPVAKCAHDYQNHLMQKTMLVIKIIKCVTCTFIMFTSISISCDFVASELTIEKT